MTDSTLQAMTQMLFGVTNPLFHARGDFAGNTLERKDKMQILHSTALE